MVNLPRILAWALGLVGIAFLADAVRRGTASVLLVLVFPVVTGGSLEFLAAVAAIVAALLAGFYSIGTPEGESVGPAGSASPAGPGGSGGVLLVGPVPIFFGSWKHPSRRAWAAWLLLGLVLTVAVMLLVLAEPYGL